MILLGLDPGTATSGYALAETAGDSVRPIAYGAIRTSQKFPAAQRLAQIYDRIAELMEEHHPEVLVVERLFFCNNERTALAVGRTLGVAMLAAAQRGIEVVEYTPLQVKSAVVGYGAADKSQVQYMVQRILKLAEQPKPDDVADALALCITHAHSMKMNFLKTPTDPVAKTASNPRR